MSQETKAALDDLKHAGEFTKIENTAIVHVLRGWFGSLSAIPGALEAGDDAWAFTTLQEHFDSKLNPDPTKRTREQVVLLGVTEKSQEDAGSGGRNFGSRIRRGQADQQTRGCICWAACETVLGQNSFSDSERFVPACQLNSPEARIADSSSRNAANFSSACTTKCFPSSRCALAIRV